MNLNPFAFLNRPKPPVHSVPRFHAATKAEQRRADAATKARLTELSALRDSVPEDARKALIERALTVQFDKQQGRAQ